MTTNREKSKIVDITQKLDLARSLPINREYNTRLIPVDFAYERKVIPVDFSYGRKK